MSETNVPRTDSDLTIKQGSTFWDWAMGDHGTIRRYAVAAVAVAALVLS